MPKAKVKQIAKRARVQSPAEDAGLKWSWSWRSLAACVYLAICLVDFLAMPIYREYAYTKMPVAEMVRLSMQMKDGAAQIETLKTLKEDRAWQPITNDMFHLSFGAILGVSALPMARNRLRRRKTYYDDQDSDGDFDLAAAEDENEGEGETNQGDYEGEGDFSPQLPTPSGRT